MTSDLSADELTFLHATFDLARSGDTDSLLALLDERVAGDRPG